MDTNGLKLQGFLKISKVEHLSSLLVVLRAFCCHSVKIILSLLKNHTPMIVSIISMFFSKLPSPSVLFNLSRAKAN
jgi:hypothetical protein